MPVLLWVAAIGFGLLYAASFVLVGLRTAQEWTAVYVASSIPLFLYALLLLLGLAYIAGKVRRIERRLDDLNP